MGIVVQRKNEAFWLTDPMLGFDLISDLEFADEMIPHENPSPTTSPAKRLGPTCNSDSSDNPEPTIDRPLTVQRIDPPKLEVEPRDSDSKGATGDDKKRSKSKSPTKRSRRPDPVMQSMMLLLTMGVMLMAARFAVPRIVEEIRYAWHRGQLRAEYETGSAGLKNVSLDALSQAYQMVTAAVGPSVVHIEVERRSDFNDKAVASMLGGGLSPASDQGSGVIVDTAGYIVTNRHVIVDGEVIQVTLSDGRRVPASIIGTDEQTDLAVLKVEADGIMPIAWGDSDRCKVGSPVWAVGSPFGLDRTVTFGILSGKNRKVRASTQYQDFMQSDVAVNPGNSGGPLVDARGTLIGINTAIVGDTYQGVSFSIPSTVVKAIYERIRETGHVERGWLGVALAEVPDDRLISDDHRTRGALVTGIAGDHSPAAIAGVMPDDLIIEVNDEAVRDVGHLMRVIGNSMAGSSVRLKLRRDDADLAVVVELNSRPVELNAP